MRWLWLVALGSTTACDVLSSSAFTLNDPSCNAPVAELSRDLTWHLLQDSVDGAFDYFPGGSVLMRVAGTYDPVSGDFAWTETANGDSFLDEVTVEGYGYANRNGDLDVIGTRRTLDELGVEDTRQFRIERAGCGTTNRVRYSVSGIEREIVETGVYLPDRYGYNSEIDLGNGTYEISGERLLDLTFSEELAADQEGYTMRGTRTGDLLAGTSLRTYAETFESGATREGTEARENDGSRQVDFTQVTSSGTTTWSYRVDYAGNGDGTVTGQGFSCTLLFEQGRCTYDCSGQRGNC